VIVVGADGGERYPWPLSLWALPGAMLPISNTPGSVAVWATPSEFNQLKTGRLSPSADGFGEYTPFLIVTVSRLRGFMQSGFLGVGVHGAVELVMLGLVERPHPIAKSANRTTAPTVDRVALESLKTMFDGGATPVPSRQPRLLLSTRMQKAIGLADRRRGLTVTEPDDLLV